MDFTVNSDGSGSFEVEMSVARELLQMAAAFEEGDAEVSAEEVCQEMMQGEETEGSPFEDLSFGGASFEVEEATVPSAVLSGIFKTRNLEQAQDQHLTIFWAHDLRALATFIRATQSHV